MTERAYEIVPEATSPRLNLNVLALALLGQIILHLGTVRDLDMNYQEMFLKGNENSSEVQFF